MTVYVITYMDVLIRPHATLTPPLFAMMAHAYSVLMMVPFAPMIFAMAEHAPILQYPVVVTLMLTALIPTPARIMFAMV